MESINPNQQNQNLSSQQPSPQPQVRKVDEQSVSEGISQKGSRSEHIFYYSAWVFTLARWIFILIAFLVLIHFFIATIFVVSGHSMDPNFADGQYIMVDRISYLIGDPQRGDVVILRFPGDPEHEKYIKRVVALPGETIEIKEGKVYINNQELTEFYISPAIETEPNLKKTLAADEYFTIGDNRLNSSDSRIWGPCPDKDIIGKAWMILLPFSDISMMPEVEYFYKTKD